MRRVQLGVLMLLGSVAVAALWSCSEHGAAEQEQAAATQGQEQGPSQTSAAGGTMMRQSRESCPMVVQGAEVSVSDTDDGVALTFTTDEGDVGGLRERVEHMAEMYERHQGHRGMMWHHMKGGTDHGRPGMGQGHMAGRGPMPAASGTVTEIDNGARLELQPTDASQLDALREHVRRHQQRMSSGECWMLQDGEGPDGTEPSGVE